LLSSFKKLLMPVFLIMWMRKAKVNLKQKDQSGKRNNQDQNLSIS